MVEDWLESVPTIPARLDEALAAVGSLPAPRTPVILRPTLSMTPRAQLARAKRALTPRQADFLRIAEEVNFSKQRAVAALADFDSRLTLKVVNRWIRTDKAFAKAWTLSRQFVLDEIVQPAALKMRAHQIAEEALAPKPILHQGNPTGYFENHPEVALRANEQLLKVEGMLRSDEKTTRVTVRIVNLTGQDEVEAIEGTAEVVE